MIRPHSLLAILFLRSLATSRKRSRREDSSTRPKNYKSTMRWSCVAHVSSETAYGWRNPRKSEDENFLWGSLTRNTISHAQLQYRLKDSSLEISMHWVKGTMCLVFNNEEILPPRLDVILQSMKFLVIAIPILLILRLFWLKSDHKKF